MRFLPSKVSARLLHYHVGMTETSAAPLADPISSNDPISPTFPAEAQTVLRTIQQRRSVDLLKLKPDTVPDDVLQAVLEAGAWAPSHGRREPWHFTVFTGAGRERLADLFARAYAASSAKDADSADAQQNQRNRVMKAPVWISLELHIPQPPKFPEWEEQAAVACAVQNMMLAATAFGLVGKWVSGVAMLSPLTARELGAPQLLGFLFLGYPAEGLEIPERKRAPLTEKVTWVR